MKIAIKYCGGCKSRYDRVGVVNKIKDNFPEIQFCYLKDTDEYDGLIVVEACDIACAEIEVKDDMDVLQITPQNFKRIADLVRNYLQLRSEKINGKRA